MAAASSSVSVASASSSSSAAGSSVSGVVGAGSASGSGSIGGSYSYYPILTPVPAPHDQTTTGYATKWSAQESESASLEREKLGLTATKYHEPYTVESHLEYENYLQDSADASKKQNLDYLSPKEKEVLKLLKLKLTDVPPIPLPLTAEQKKEAAKTGAEEKKTVDIPMSNRELVVFLIARKWDVQRTVELIQNYKKLRVENHLISPIRLEDIDPSLKERPFSFTPPLLFDHHYRPISYIIMSKYTPKDHTFDRQLKLSLYVLEKFIHCYPISAWRRGIVYIEDIGNMSRQNMGGDMQKSFNLLQNCLPLRINKILILNPNWMIKILFKIASLFMKKGLMSRIFIVTKEELPYVVPKEAILEEWGGSLKLTPHNDLLQRDLPLLPDLLI